MGRWSLSSYLDPMTLFKLSQESFEKFYESHETRESKIALEAINNFRGLFQGYVTVAEEMQKHADEIQKEEVEAK